MEQQVQNRLLELGKLYRIREDAVQEFERKMRDFKSGEAGMVQDIRETARRGSPSLQQWTEDQVWRLQLHKDAMHSRHGPAPQDTVGPMGNGQAPHSRQQGAPPGFPRSTNGTSPQGSHEKVSEGPWPRSMQQGQTLQQRQVNEPQTRGRPDSSPGSSVGHRRTNTSRRDTWADSQELRSAGGSQTWAPGSTSSPHAAASKWEEGSDDSDSAPPGFESQSNGSLSPGVIRNLLPQSAGGQSSQHNRWEGSPVAAVPQRLQGRLGTPAEAPAQQGSQWGGSGGPAPQQAPPQQRAHWGGSEAGTRQRSAQQPPPQQRSHQQRPAAKAPGPGWDSPEAPVPQRAPQGRPAAQAPAQQGSDWNAPVGPVSQVAQQGRVAVEAPVPQRLQGRPAAEATSSQRLQERPAVEAPLPQRLQGRPAVEAPLPQRLQGRLGGAQAPPQQAPQRDQQAPQGEIATAEPSAQHGSLWEESEHVHQDKGQSTSGSQQSGDNEAQITSWGSSEMPEQDDFPSLGGFPAPGGPAPSQAQPRPSGAWGTGGLTSTRITQPPPGTRNQQEHRVASLLARQAQPPQLQQGVPVEQQEVQANLRLATDGTSDVMRKSRLKQRTFENFERVKNRELNVVEGLELHENVLDPSEQIRMVESIEEWVRQGRAGKLRGRTFSAPKKWIKGKGRVTCQFGCCYNYAKDSQGRNPGIIAEEVVEPLPPALLALSKRLVRWGIVPRNKCPDTAIINVYEVDDCIPPHIDHHDFDRPFCTISLLSEESILFSNRITPVSPGVFDCDYSIKLPVGSCLVLKGNGADVAQHCVPPVNRKRMSITLRRMQDYHARQVLQHANEVWNQRGPSAGLALSAPAAPQQPERMSADDAWEQDEADDTRRRAGRQRGGRGKW